MSKLGHKHSEETKAKLRAAWKHRAPVSQETRQKIADAHRGMKRSEETRQRMKIALTEIERKPRSVIPVYTVTCKWCGQPFESKSSRGSACTICFPDRAARGRGYNYGITHPQFLAMMAHQDGKCAICRCELVLEKRKGGQPYINIDHNHKTGKTRGILCPRCNTFLPMIDDEAWRNAALAYLKEYDGAVADPQN